MLSGAEVKLSTASQEEDKCFPDLFFLLVLFCFEQVNVVQLRLAQRPLITLVVIQLTGRRELLGMDVQGLKLWPVQLPCEVDCSGSDSMLLSWVISKSAKKQHWSSMRQICCRSQDTSGARCVRACVLRGDACVINRASTQWRRITPFTAEPIQLNRTNSVQFSSKLISIKDCFEKY